MPLQVHGNRTNELGFAGAGRPVQKEVELSLHAGDRVRALLTVKLVAEGVAWDAEYTVLLRMEERVMVFSLLLFAPVDGLLQKLWFRHVRPLRPTLITRCGGEGAKSMDIV